MEQYAVRMQKWVRGQTVRRKLSAGEFVKLESEAEAKNKELIKAGAFVLTYSTNASLFWSGISRITGPPTSQLEQPILTSIEDEHVNANDSHSWFEAANHGYQTTSAIEWRFVVCPSDDESWPGTIHDPAVRAADVIPAP